LIKTVNECPWIFWSDPECD